jgi:hypothetical protein
VTDFAPDAVMSHFEQTQRAKERRARLWGNQAPRRVNKPIPKQEVRSEPVTENIEPVEENIEPAPALVPVANDNEAPAHRPTVAFVVAHVARYYGLSSKDVCAQRRDLDAAWSRHIAVYLAKELTPNSWAEIARRIGGRDHSTALNSYARVTEALAVSPEIISADLDAIRERVVARVSPSHVPRRDGNPFWAANRIKAPVRKVYPRVRSVNRDFWTRDQVAELVRLWGDGLTHQDIAATFGTTKGAVAGKIARLGIVRNKRASH